MCHIVPPVMQEGYIFLCIEEDGGYSVASADICIGEGGDGGDVEVDDLMPRRRRRWRFMIPDHIYGAEILSALWGIRWLILRILSGGKRTTSEIFSEIVSKFGMMIPRSLLYYHLSELESMGVIEMIGYRETGKGGAPEKIWRLKIQKIVVDILSGNISIIPMEG